MPNVPFDLQTFTTNVQYQSEEALREAIRRDVVLLRDAFPTDRGPAWVWVGRGRIARRVAVSVNRNRVVSLERGAA